jgi:hypothetical protein
MRLLRHNAITKHLQGLCVAQTMTSHMTSREAHHPFDKLWIQAQPTLMLNGWQGRWSC